MSNIIKSKQTLINISLVGQGVVPFDFIDDNLATEQIRLTLSSMKKEESRSVERKYRKLWRKASRALGREMLRKNKVRSKNRLFNKLRTKGKKPDEIQHLLRRACVVWYINSKIEVLGDN